MGTAFANVSCASPSNPPSSDAVGGAGGSAGEGGSGNGGSGNGGSGNGGSGNGGSGAETGAAGETGSTSTDGTAGGSGGSGAGGSGSGASGAGGSGGSTGPCAEGWVLCDETCIDPRRDLRFCGASGNCSGMHRGLRCAAYELCVAGSCPGSWQEPEQIYADSSVMSARVVMNDAGDAVAAWSNPILFANPNVWGGNYSLEDGWDTLVIDDWVEGDDLRLAIDEGGNATVLWTDYYDQLRAGHYLATSGWQAATGPVSSGADAADVAMDANGTALAVWTEGGELWSNRHLRGGDWGTSEQLQPADAEKPRVAMNPLGRAIVVWSRAEETGERLWSSSTDAGAAWTTPEPLQEAPVESLALGDLAVDAQGDAVAIWGQQQDQSIWANRFSAETGWEGAELLDATGVDFNVPQVAMDLEGNAIAVWLRTDAGTPKVWSSRHTLDSGWSTPELISGLGDACDQPHVAVSASGDAVAVWSQDDPGLGALIWSNRYIPGSGWGEPTFVDLPTDGSDGVDVAIDADGNALAVWSRDNSVFANLSPRPR